MANALVHSCFNPLWQKRPILCGCNYWVRWIEAESMVKRGEAVFAKWTGSNGKEYPDLRNVALTGKLARFPGARTIPKAAIVNAYVEGNEAEAERIEDYGALSAEVLFSIGATARVREFFKTPELAVA